MTDIALEKIISKAIRIISYYIIQILPFLYLLPTCNKALTEIKANKSTLPITKENLQRKPKAIKILEFL